MNIGFHTGSYYGLAPAKVLLQDSCPFVLQDMLAATDIFQVHIGSPVSCELLLS